MIIMSTHPPISLLIMNTRADSTIFIISQTEVEVCDSGRKEGTLSVKFVCSEALISPTLVLRLKYGNG